jgi:hypothetical protein
MSNTVIQIKRSSSSAVPASLNAAEPAYSYVSNKLFLGDASGTGVIAVGGKFYVDQQNTIFDVANAAFIKANTGDPIGIAAFDTANAAFTKANVANQIASLAYDTANIAIANVNFANTVARAAFDFANTVSTVAIAGNITANASYDKANAANVFAYNNSLAVTAGYDTANAGFAAANAGFNKANSAETIAIAAYANSNTKLSTSGGTITGDLAIVGNISVSGNTSYISVQNYRVDDPLIYLAGNNYISDIVDIGFIANYVNATSANVHTGFLRNHEDKEYYLFYGYDQEPVNNHVDVNGNNFTIAVLNADLKTSNLVLGGQNTIVWIRSSYDQANVATAAAIAGNITANAAYNAANGAFLNSNAAFDAANAGFITANAGFGAANAAFLNSNVAFNAANASFNAANAAFVNSNSAFDKANSATTIASAAYDQANTANVNAANASFLSTGTVPSSVISGSYTNITGVGILTTGVWNAQTVDTSYGGTGRTTFTTNGILYGNTSGPINVTSAGTEGQVLQASASGVPQFAMLDGGSF